MSVCVCAHARVNWELVITEWMALMEIALLGAGKLNIKKRRIPNTAKSAVMILQTINTCINYFICWNGISHKVNSKKGGLILTCSLRHKRHECGSMRHPVTLRKQSKSSFQFAFSISFTIPSRGMMLLIFKVGLLHTSTNLDSTAQTKSVFSSKFHLASITEGQL